MSKIIYPDDNEIQEQIQEIINKSGIFEDAADDTIREIHSVDNRRNKRIHVMREFATIAAAAIIVIMGSVVVASIAGRNTEAYKNNSVMMGNGNTSNSTSTEEAGYRVVMNTETKNYSFDDSMRMNGQLEITYPVIYVANDSILRITSSYYDAIASQHIIGNGKMTVYNAEYSAVQSAGFKLKNSGDYVVSFYNMYDYVILSFLSYYECSATINEITGATFRTDDTQVKLSDIFASANDYYNAVTYIASKENEQPVYSGYDTIDNTTVSVQDSDQSAYICFNMSYSDIKNIATVYSGSQSDKTGDFNWYLTNDGIVLTASVPEYFNALNSETYDKDVKAIMSTYGIDTNKITSYTFEVSSVKVTFDELKDAGIELAIETE